MQFDRRLSISEEALGAFGKIQTCRDKEVNQAARDSDDALVCCVKNTIKDLIMDSSASFHATYYKKELERFKLRSGEILKDVRNIPSVKRRLISVGQLDEEGYHVGFGDQQWKVTKGSLVVAHGNKRGSLYMVKVQPEGIGAVINGSGSTAVWFGEAEESFLHNISEDKETVKVRASKSYGRIVMLKMVPETPLQFGVAERLSRTFRVESTRLRVEAPKMLWADSVSMTYLIYRIPYVLTGLRIPDKEWPVKDTSLVHLKVFGCDLFVKVKDVYGEAMKCTFIGSGSDEMRYSFWDTKSHQVIRSRDITFVDSIYGAKSTTDSSSLTKPIQKSQVVLVDIPENLVENDSIVANHGSSSEITQSLGGSSDTSKEFENSKTFEDSGRSDKKDFEDRAFSKEGGSKTLQREFSASWPERKPRVQIEGRSIRTDSSTEATVDDMLVVGSNMAEFNKPKYTKSLIHLAKNLKVGNEREVEVMRSFNWPLIELITDDGVLPETGYSQFDNKVKAVALLMLVQDTLYRKSPSLSLGDDEIKVLAEINVELESRIHKLIEKLSQEKDSQEEALGEFNFTLENVIEKLSHEKDSPDEFMVLSSKLVGLAPHSDITPGFPVSCRSDSDNTEMEGVDETPKASQVALEEDVISRMPDIVMNNILDRLPTQEAVRTAVLSKDWRYKWKILSQLVFDEKFYGFLQTTKNERYYGRIISSLMHQLKDSIKKFVLCIDDKCYSVMDAEDINKWIIYLTENGLKQLTIKYLGEKPLRLTSHIFSYLELTRLDLQNCELAPGTDYCCFPNLLGLNLIWVDIETYKCGEFLTRCPNLEKLDFSSWNYDINETHIAKLVNLKKLLWQLGTFKNTKLLCSPLLKQIVITADTPEVFGDDHGDSVFATKLLKLHRASPVAAMDLVRQR
nr:hypothetical protein [Tanacetum cinerariifolium]